jgi:hypothetical protein
VALGPGAVLGDPLQLSAERALLLGVGHLGELVLGEQAGLDAHGELDLFGGVQQRHLTDLLEVVLDRVSRRTGDGTGVDRDFVFIVDHRQHQRAAGQRLGGSEALGLGVVVFGVVLVGGGSAVVVAGVGIAGLLLTGRGGLRLGGGCTLARRNGFRRIARVSREGLGGLGGGTGRGGLLRRRLRRDGRGLVGGCGLGGLQCGLCLRWGCHSNTSHAVDRARAARPVRHSHSAWATVKVKRGFWAVRFWAVLGPMSSPREGIGKKPMYPGTRTGPIDNYCTDCV